MPNDAEYLPTEKEILDRGNAVAWMRIMEWEWEIIDQIMYFDNPCLETVKRIVYRYGPEEAYGILQEFLEWPQ